MRQGDARKRVGVATVGRSDFSILEPLVERLGCSETLEVGFLVSGAHYDARAGLTVSVVRDSGAPIWAELPVDPYGHDARGMTGAVAAILARTGDALPDLDLDLCIVLGDRFEAYAMGLACFLQGVPVAHVSGGCITEGAIDDVFRHSLTQLAHLHFCDLPRFAERIRQIGAAPETVSAVGALGLDGISLRERPGHAALRKFYDGAFPAEPGFLLVSLHPETLDIAGTGAMADALIEALERSGREVLFTYPNADPGADEIIVRIEAAVARTPRFHAVPSLGPVNFYGALATAGAMVGNSSAGIIEAGSFALPVVDIGNRQGGRFRDVNVVHCAPEAKAIHAAIKTALSDEMARRLDGFVNPYGDGRAGARVVAELERALARPLPPRRFTDFDPVAGARPSLRSTG